MNQNESEINFDNQQDITTDDLETKLEAQLEEQLTDLKELEEDMDKIGSPESLGNTVMNVVWEQFVNQIGTVAGEDFIKENRGLKLDLRDSAHIQTTENFEKGKIATHNDKIDYQERYDTWQSKLEHDENGQVKCHYNSRTGKTEKNLAPGARSIFDKGRPTGSWKKGTDMDHTVPAAELIRRPDINAHMSESEQVVFANSAANLNEIPAEWNRSKKDNTMTDWLDKPNSRGQKASDQFNISNEEDKALREKDREARAELERLEKEGEKKSVETGKQSQKEEAQRIGGKALRSVIMGLLASLLKDVIRQLISWFRSGAKKLSTFIDAVKKALMSFIKDLKQHLLNAGNTLITTITTAIFGPVISAIKKAWIFLKQGYKSTKEAIDFMKDPANRSMPFSIKIMQVGKIIIAGITAGGAIALGEVIEKGLMTIPVFAFEIPLLGSLASLLGIFLGAIVSGIIGALALNLIDRAIAKKQRKINREQQIDKGNEILKTQDEMSVAVSQGTVITKYNVSNNIKDKHLAASDYVNDKEDKIRRNSLEISKTSTKVSQNASESEDIQKKNQDNLDDINALLNSL